MSKIDTQGMGAPMSEEDLVKWKASPEYKKQVHKPMMVKPDRLLTPCLLYTSPSPRD